MPEVFYTPNQIVAYNLARARRSWGWTQGEAAKRLSMQGGKAWSAATVGAAERSFSTERMREFNAAEIFDFALVFDKPVSYFFIPPDPKGKRIGIVTKRLQGDEWDPYKATDISHAFRYLIPLHFGEEVISDVNRILGQYGLVWDACEQGSWSEGRSLKYTPEVASGLVGIEEEGEEGEEPIGDEERQLLDYIATEAVRRANDPYIIAEHVFEIMKERNYGTFKGGESGGPEEE